MIKFKRFRNSKIILLISNVFIKKKINSLGFELISNTNSKIKQQINRKGIKNFPLRISEGSAIYPNNFCFLFFEKSLKIVKGNIGFKEFKKKDFLFYFNLKQ